MTSKEYDKKLAELRKKRQQREENKLKREEKDGKSNA